MGHWNPRRHGRPDRGQAGPRRRPRLVPVPDRRRRRGRPGRGARRRRRLLLLGHGAAGVRRLPRATSRARSVQRKFGETGVGPAGRAGTRDSVTDENLKALARRSATTRRTSSSTSTRRYRPNVGGGAQRRRSPSMFAGAGDSPDDIVDAGRPTPRRARATWSGRHDQAAATGGGRGRRDSGGAGGAHAAGGRRTSERRPRLVTTGSVGRDPALLVGPALAALRWRSSWCRSAMAAYYSVFDWNGLTAARPVRRARQLPRGAGRPGLPGRDRAQLHHRRRCRSLIQLPLALGIALLAQPPDPRARRSLRTVIFAPYVLSEVIDRRDLAADPAARRASSTRLHAGASGSAGSSQLWLADPRHRPLHAVRS